MEATSGAAQMTAWKPGPTLPGNRLTNRAPSRGMRGRLPARPCQELRPSHGSRPDQALLRWTRCQPPRQLPKAGRCTRLCRLHSGLLIKIRQVRIAHRIPMAAKRPGRNTRSSPHPCARWGNIPHCSKRTRPQPRGGLARVFGRHLRYLSAQTCACCKYLSMAAEDHLPCNWIIWRGNPRLLRWAPAMRQQCPPNRWTSLP